MGLEPGRSQEGVLQTKKWESQLYSNNWGKKDSKQAEVP